MAKNQEGQFDVLKGSHEDKKEMMDTSKLEEWKREALLAMKQEVLKSREDLEEKMKAFEGDKSQEIFKAEELSLVPGIVLPPKFKRPDFEKYNGAKCPKLHLMMFCQKMAAYAHDEKLLIHCFQYSLTGTAASWYCGLKKDQICTWRDLARAFMGRYEHMLEEGPDRITVQNMRKDPSESFKDYACRWKEVASQVQPPLTLKEINSVFINTLPPLYYHRMIGNPSLDFADLIFAGSKIEEGVKKGKIVGGIEEQVQAMGFERKDKRKGNQDHSSQYVHNLSQNLNSCVQPPVMIEIPDDQGPKSEYPRGNKRKRARIYHPLPLSYTELLPLLIQHNKIAIIPSKQRKPPYPSWFDPSVKCEYHGGIRGHSTENCTPFKDKIQALIDENSAKFHELIGVSKKW